MKPEELEAKVAGIKDALFDCDEFWEFVLAILEHEHLRFANVDHEHRYYQGRMHGAGNIVRQLANIVGRKLTLTLDIEP